MNKEIEELKAKLAALEKAQTATPVPGLKIDIGCGPNKKEGFLGVDIRQFDGKVDVILDAGRHVWPWPDNSVDEVHCSHMLEHLAWEERVHFFNELYRVMKPGKDGGKAVIIIPHWCSSRYYGDPTHKAPFSEMGWYYLSKKWRLENAPHVDAEKAPGPLAYSCDFEASYGYSPASGIVMRSSEYQMWAMANLKEAVADMMATLAANK